MFDLERVTIVDEETHFEADPLGMNIVPSREEYEATQAGDIAYRTLTEIAGKSGLEIGDLIRMVSARDRAEQKRLSRRAKIVREEGRRYA